ncbi:MAG: hypothetical protein AAF927_33270 [Bacteroidota bacterium]
MNPKLLLALFSFVFLAACGIYTINPEGMKECHERIEITEDIDAALLGRWQWTGIRCEQGKNNPPGNVYKGMEIEFIGRDTLLIWYQDKLVGGIDRQIDVPFLWEEDLVEDFSLKYLALGQRFWLCEDKLLFHYRQIDACDNLFKRKD